MGKLSSLFKEGMDKFKGLSKGKKAAYIILAIGIIVSLALTLSYTTSTKYEVLFSNMDTQDSGNVISKLKEKKATYEIKGNSILVPKTQVDQLRMEILSEVTFTNGSKGWELLDNTSQLGTTDEQMKLNYQRALQGELERTIKTFPQIEGCRVILVPAEESAFVTDQAPASASVALKIKSGQTLSKQQISAIISLVSGSVKNLPKENVQVVDDKMTTLSNGIFKSDGTETLTSDLTDEESKRQLAKKQYEKSLEDKIYNQLEPIYKDGVRVTINADLDFDANQSVATTYGNNQVVSEHDVKSTTTNPSGTTSTTSPVDNNMTNSISNTTTGTGTTTNEDVTKNYEVSKVESKNIKAPGDVKKITASVVLNGNVDDNTKTIVKNLVVNSIGYDEKRGDNITVESLPFDNTAKTAAKKAVDEMKAQTTADSKNAIYKQIGIGAGAAMVLLLLLIAFKRRNKDNDEIDEDMLNIESEGLKVKNLSSQKENTLVMPDGTTMQLDEISTDSERSQQKVQKPNFKPIEFEVEDEHSHLEKELKKYAMDKPDQVADIIKSWLADDER